jgi:hypothetical protein
VPKIDQWKCGSLEVTQQLQVALMKLASSEKELKIKGKLALRVPEACFIIELL